MMKNNKKKGFTIVELVIVIAVIAILAAVLIPTFSNVVEKANESKAMQAARNEYELYLSEHATEISDDMDLDVVVTDGGKTYVFKVVAGQFNADGEKKAYDASGKDDLTAVKSEKLANAPEDWATTYGNYYTDAACTIKVSAASVTATDCYKLVRNAIEGQNSAVAIYAA